MKVDDIKACYIGPDISPEQFVPEHIFLYLIKGTITGYDGKHHYLKPGEQCLVQKNRLARYNKQKENEEFEKVVIIFDEAFLKRFQQKYTIVLQENFTTNAAFIKLDKSALLNNFLSSLNSYFTSSGKISETFSELKREELLLILLEQQPALKGIFFNFKIPNKIDLEAFMLTNYKFNVSVERFAYLTGRSLSSFKREFKQIFKDTPSRWLVNQRLKEARFLIETKMKKPSEIYLELGFEDLSHFSFAFKKMFGLNPSQLAFNYRK